MGETPSSPPTALAALCFASDPPFPFPPFFEVVIKDCQIADGRKEGGGGSKSLRALEASNFFSPLPEESAFKSGTDFFSLFPHAVYKLDRRGFFWAARVTNPPIRWKRRKGRGGTAIIAAKRRKEGNLNWDHPQQLAGPEVDEKGEKKEWDFTSNFSRIFFVGRRENGWCSVHCTLREGEGKFPCVLAF